MYIYYDKLCCVEGIDGTTSCSVARTHHRYLCSILDHGIARKRRHLISNFITIKIPMVTAPPFFDFIQFAEARFNCLQYFPHLSFSVPCFSDWCDIKHIINGRIYTGWQNLAAPYFLSLSDFPNLSNSVSFHFFIGYTRDVINRRATTIDMRVDLPNVLACRTGKGRHRAGRPMGPMRLAASAAACSVMVPGISISIRNATIGGDERRVEAGLENPLRRSCTAPTRLIVSFLAIAFVLEYVPPATCPKESRLLLGRTEDAAATSATTDAAATCTTTATMNYCLWRLTTTTK